MSKIKVISCEYRDGTEIYFFENVFELTPTQKEELKSKISQLTMEEHKQNPFKMTINSTQEKDILQVHKDIISALKEAYSVESDEELADILYENELIVFSKHALSRLVERFSGKTDSPFSKMYEALNLDPQTSSELASQATEVFVQANKVESKIEWSVSPYCRINYSLEGDKTTLSVENHYLPEEEIDKLYFVVTVMKKDPQ